MVQSFKGFSVPPMVKIISFQMVSLAPTSIISFQMVSLTSTVKPVLSGQLKLDKTKILMTNGSLMKVESIAECSPWSNAPI